MSRFDEHPDGPADYVEAGRHAPEPDPSTDTPCMFCGCPDPDHTAQCEGSRGPQFEATRAYYAGPDGTPCPICDGPKPRHEPGCSEAGDYGPSYRLTPADLEEFPWAR